jgi:hypothetical protein
VRWLASLCCAAITGCATQVQIPEKVLVPIPVACLDRLPDAPSVSKDAELLALDDYALVLTIASERKLLEVAYGELRAVAQACVR